MLQYYGDYNTTLITNEEEAMYYLFTWKAGVYNILSFFVFYIRDRYFLLKIKLD